MIIACPHNYDPFTIPSEGEMTLFTDFFAALYTMPLALAALLSLLGNVLMFAAALLVGDALVRRYHDKPNSAPPEPISRQEILFALACVVLNALVAVVGIILWRAGIINLRPNGDVLATVMEALRLACEGRLRCPDQHRGRQVRQGGERARLSTCPVSW